jgi:hypothetical protein
VFHEVVPGAQHGLVLVGGSGSHDVQVALAEAGDVPLRHLLGEAVGVANVVQDAEPCVERSVLVVDGFAEDDVVVEPVVFAKEPVDVGIQLPGGIRRIVFQAARAVRRRAGHTDVGVHVDNSWDVRERRGWHITEQASLLLLGW